MAKKKTINGVTYYPKKRHEDGYCQNCGLYITESTSVYRKGSEDSSELICAKCVNDMFVEKQRDNDRSIVEYPVEERLFVGTRHKCGKVTLENIPFYFENEGRMVKVVIKKCPKCNSFFISSESRRANSYFFKKYQLLSAETGKPLPQSVVEGFVGSNRKKEYEKEEIPNSVQWAIKHPFQGGSCSGK